MKNLIGRKVKGFKFDGDRYECGYCPSMNENIDKKVMVSDRLPELSGEYITNTGLRTFSGIFECFILESGIEYWLEEIELPSDEEICKEGFYNSMCSISFTKGANYILNKLK